MTIQDPKSTRTPDLGSCGPIISDLFGILAHVWLLHNTIFAKIGYFDLAWHLEAILLAWPENCSHQVHLELKELSNVFFAFLALLHLFTANLGGSARNSEIVQFQLFGNSAFIYSIGARYSLYCCLLWRSESINNTSASVSTHTVTEYECTASIIGCNVSEYYALPWHSTYNRHIFMQKY